MTELLLLRSHLAYGLEYQTQQDQADDDTQYGA